MFMYIYIHFFALSDDPVAIANPAPRCCFLLSLFTKRPRVLGEVTDSRTRAGNIQYAPGASPSTSREVLKHAHTHTMKGI